MRVYVVVGVYDGYFNSLNVFISKKQAKQSEAKIIKYYRDKKEKQKIQGYDITLVTYDIESDTEFAKTADGENILWCLLEKDAQDVAKEDFETKLSLEELKRVRKCLDSSLENWNLRMITAVEEALQERKHKKNSKK